MRYINPKSSVTGRILGMNNSPIIKEHVQENVQDHDKYKLSMPKILKTQEKSTTSLIMGKGIGDNKFRDKLKKLSLESVPQKEKLKNISFDL